MKKFVAKVLVLVMTLAVAVSAFVACDWITVNTDRDLAQVAATVKIADGIAAQDILKKDLRARYMSYEYQYVYYYGYTTQKAYQTALENLVKNRIIVQQARLDLAAAYNDSLNKADAELDETTLYFKNNALANKKAIAPANGEITVQPDVTRVSVEGLVQYLTVYEYKQAYYNVRRSINSMIESNMEEEDEEEHESATYTARTTPSVDEDEDDTESFYMTDKPTHHERLDASATLGDDAYDETKYANVYDLNLAVYDAYKIDIDSSSERKKAFNTMISNLKENGLIGQDEKFDYVDENKNSTPDNVLNYSYFKNLLKSQMEATIVSKYEDWLISSNKVQLTDDAVYEQYKIDFEAQKAQYKNDYSAYESALDASSDKSLVLYNPYEGYGFVSNILIGFSSEQSAILSAKKSENGVDDEAIDATRTRLFGELDAADQRASWVYNNYGDYDAENGTFAFEDEYLIDTVDAALNEKLSKFIGTIDFKDSYETDHDGAKETVNLFNSADATKIPFDTFMNDYMKDIGFEKAIFAEGDAATVKMLGAYDGTASVMDEADLDTLKALCFAFSTDPGILSKTYGYIYSPYTSKSTYVKEFAAAAKEVVAKGVGAYTIVGTDYGYHIMVCTKKIAKQTEMLSKEAFLADVNVEGTLAYNYREIKYSSYSDQEINKYVSKKVNDSLKDAVTYFEKNYDDLVKETSAN